MSFNVNQKEQKLVQTKESKELETAEAPGAADVTLVTHGYTIATVLPAQ